MQYDSVLKYVDEVTTNFNQFTLHVLLVPLPDPIAVAGATIYRMIDRIDWTQVFEDIEYLPI